MANGPRGVTPIGVRNGDPDALLAFTAAAGGAVLAYCRAVCGDEAAPHAAAESFARFRAAVCAAQDASVLDPETMLLGATRHAAASMAMLPEELPRPGGLASHARRRGATESCAMVPTMLAARAEHALSAEDEERLTRHLERCLPCSTVEANFAEAERLYADPPDIPLPAGFAEGIVAAMVAAVPPEALLQTVERQTEALTPAPPADEPVEAVDEELPAAQPAHEEPEPVEDQVLDEEPEPVSEEPIEEAPVILETDDHPAVISIRGRPDGAPPPLPAPVERRRPAALADLVLPAAIILVGVLAAMIIAGVFGGDDAEPAQSHEVRVRLAAPRPPVTTPLPVTAGGVAPDLATSTTTTTTPTTPAPAGPIITTTVTP